jgi:hypothetical protein
MLERVDEDMAWKGIKVESVLSRLGRRYEDVSTVLWIDMH